MKTKQLLAAAFSFLALLSAGAQKDASYAYVIQKDFATLNPAPNNAGAFSKNVSPAFAFNEEKYRKFKKMRTGGIVLTSVGVGLIGTGVALIASAANENDYDGYDDYYSDDVDGKIIGGAFCIVFGALSTGGGITMWAIGNKKMKKYGGGQMSLNATKTGLGVAYKL